MPRHWRGNEHQGEHRADGTGDPQRRGRGAPGYEGRHRKGQVTGWPVGDRTGRRQGAGRRGHNPRRTS